jgi:hypothetical protein
LGCEEGEAASVRSVEDREPDMANDRTSRPSIGQAGLLHGDDVDRADVRLSSQQVRADEGQRSRDLTA